MPPIPKAPPSIHDPKLLSRTHAATAEDDIVISGISGQFPNSKNVEEYAYNLYNKIDMVDDEEIRWRHFNVEIPKRMGKISGLEKFDATFFGVHFKQAHTMDPQCRLLVERAYEAVMDAGINPRSIRGSRCGVFVGACFSESEKTWFYEKISSGGFGITGCSRAMLANRISYSLGLTGPSYLLDTACSSSMYALDCAFSAMRNGECDSALIGGSNLILHPYVTLQFARLGVLSPNGYCRPFDIDATGYTRSEAVCMIFLQKARDAKRIYSTVLYSKTNCDGYKQEGITYPSGAMQQRLLSEFYDEVQIDPASLAYVEAHSTGTVVGDPEECQALDNIFCKNRKTPLPVGSVKSNIGHSESTAGACSIAKVVLAFETGLIAPNINFTKIRPGIPSLEDGRLSVCTDVTKLEGDLVGINAFGFGGANAHVLLRRHSKEKRNQGLPEDDLPRLVTWSGRTEESIGVLFDRLQSKPLDAEHIALLHNISSEETPGYIFRGYGLLRPSADGKTTDVVARETQHYNGLKRPVVWVFSGMGSQWATMGTSLMEIPMFKQSIEQSHKILKPYGLDLISIITTNDPTMFDNILHSFVGIAAIQIALCDILKALQIPADYFIGHSVGELGCAYADGCFTAEQMIMAAYSRGMASLETNKIRGSMAAVGMSYTNLIRKKVPDTIDVACHNGPDSCTISGPEAEIAKYVAELKAQGIFAKEVNCSHIAYHSRYIAEMGPNLLARLSKVIPEPKRRSSKWISSSVPKSRWENEETKWCSAHYHTNNLLSSVLFEEASRHLPTNAITIEIAPHGLLQAILKKSLPNATNISLAKRGNKDNVSFFLQALGKIYTNGYTVQVQNLYPPIQFPVSRGTPMISPVVRWEHGDDWFVTKFELQRSTRSGERKVKVALSGEDYDFIVGHAIDGRVLFPATAYLQLAWETLALMKGPIYFDMNVEFEDIRFLRATGLTKGQTVEFNIMVHTGTGQFEITENSTAVVTGRIVEVEKMGPLTTLPPLPPSNFPIMQERDFYKELRLRGYHYSGAFRSVLEARGDGLYGKVKWDLNWISFMDCLLQINILAKDSRSLLLPTRIQKLRINAKDHMAQTTSLDPENPFFEVFVSPELGILRCGGIEIFGMHTNSVSRRKAPGYPVLETYKYISYLSSPTLRLADAVRCQTQLILENTPMLRVKGVEVDHDNSAVPLLPEFELALGDLPLVTSDLMLLTGQELSLGKIHVEDGKLSTQTNCLLVVSKNCLSRHDFVEGAIKSIHERGYLVSRESPELTAAEAARNCPPDFNIVSMLQTDNNEQLVLLQRTRKRNVLRSDVVINISNSNDTTTADSYEWLEKLKLAIKQTTGSVIVVAQNNSRSGIVGLVNCVRKEPDGNKVVCVFIDDEHAPPFDQHLPFYQEQLKLGLAINILRNGTWGSMRHLELIQEIKAAPRNDHCYGNVLQRGDLSTFSWLQGPIDARRENDVVQVQYASINFRDVMLATGRLSAEVVGTNRLDQECILGFEFAGLNKKGERVMGTIISGAMATQLVPNEFLTWKVPDHWTLREAATVPVVYMTVYCAFFMYNPIRKGKKILIHAGSGGIGLAAIRVALAYGLEVFTTVSTPVKKKFIMDTFPQLKEENIGNSRDCSFEQMIKLRTNGEGVDFVLNSLAEEQLHASIRCLGRSGTFLEIGKFDLANDSKIGLGPFLKEITFRSVLVDNLHSAGENDKVQVYELVEKDLRRGVIQPLKSTVFEVHEIEKAYRFLSTGKHVGKVILRIRESQYDEFTVPIAAIPRLYCDPNSVYIIPGGLGGFGLELADWLIIRGARKLVLSSSRGITKGYQSYRIKIWEAYGTKILVNTDNITTRAGCEKLFNAALQLGPIGGIFNLAVVLRDSILDNQTVEKFVECMLPKATATEYLDEFSRKLAPQLKHFVIFSSVSCGRGNAGQTNYGMANSVMERIIERRHRDGLPAKAVQWGAVGEVGLVADMAEDKIDMEIGGTLQQRISSCLAELDALLTTETEPIVSSMVVAEKRVGSDGKSNLIECVSNIMGIRDIKTVSSTATLSEVGMDSLMAVEIKQTLEREFEIFLTPQDLRSLTFTKLQEYADARQTKEGQENVKLKLASEDRVTGVQLLLRNLGDEKTCKETLLRLNSINNAEKFDASLLIIPGIEGISSIAWKNIATGLNLPTFILQLTENSNRSIAEIAASLYNEVKAKVFKKQEFFYLVGYSFGSHITLELARLFEEAGMKGHVLLIDGAPNFLKHLSLATLGSNKTVTDAAIQMMLIHVICQQVFPNDNPDEIFMTISALKTWPEKVNRLVEFGIKANIEYSEQYLRDMLDALFNRLKLVFNYEEGTYAKIKSSITLVRPTEVAVVDIDEDYELSKHTEGTVNLKFIEGNHTTMLDNDKLQQIINDVDPNQASNRDFSSYIWSGKNT